MLLAKHKSFNSKIKSSETQKRIGQIRPTTVSTLKHHLNTTVKTPDNKRTFEQENIKERSSDTLNFSKITSDETLEKYILGAEIGRGAYAIVRSAINKENNGKVAIKIYDKYKLLNPNRKKNADREIMILSKLNHQNIVKLFTTIENKRTLNLIMEYVNGCSLMSYLKKKYHKKIDESEARIIFKQLIQALEYCHNLNITHRDIKLENILIDSHYAIKLIDFGFSTCFSNDRKIKLFCGTPSYMSPEIVSRQESYGPPSDI